MSHLLASLGGHVPIQQPTSTVRYYNTEPGAGPQTPGHCPWNSSCR